jgi:hypothetical protein
MTIARSIIDAGRFIPEAPPEKSYADLVEDNRKLREKVAHAEQMRAGLVDLVVERLSAGFIQCRHCGKAEHPDYLDSRTVGATRDDEGVTQYDCPGCDGHEFAEVG